MTKEIGKVTFQGNPLTLIGEEKNIGDKLPAGSLIANDLSPVNIDEIKGVKVITTVPSLDTPVCDMQIRKFNKEAAAISDVSIIALSADLPFAQARWCGGAGVDKVQTLSDHASMAYAEQLGVHIKELRLFARSVFVVNAENKIVYKEIVNEVTDEPNYEAALKAVKNA